MEEARGSLEPTRAGLLGTEPCLNGDSFMALDLEYDSSGFIWLIGACIVSGDTREYYFLWADTARDEERNLRELSALIATDGELPILTWAGVSADLPRITAAAARLGIDELTEAVHARHRDLFQYALQNIRLPIPSFSLKDVAAYYGIPKVSAIGSGVQADALYDLYRAANDERERAALRDQLTEYNRDDFDALVGAAERFRDFAVRNANRSRGEGCPSQQQVPSDLS